MNAGRMRLFSDDGTLSSNAHNEPLYVYYPEEVTLNDINYLFTVLESIQLTAQKSSKQNDGCTTVHDNIPFYADIAALLSNGNSERSMSTEDVSLACYCFI